MKKAILLASANDFASNINVVQFTTPLVPPLGILALGAYLAAHDVPVELIDVQVDFGLGLTHAAEQVVAQRVAQYLRHQADAIAWVGISQISNSSSGIVLAREIHTALPETPIILGGYCPSSIYQQLLAEHPFITAIVRGDGEAAALEISRCLAQGQSFLSEQTPNLAWRDDGEIRATPIQPMALDGLPILDFRLLRHPDCYQLIGLVASWGCPFQCNYCLEGVMRPYVTHSPAWVARQLDHLEATVPNDAIYFYDPTFGLGRARTLELCRVLRGRRFRYAVASRVDVLPPDLVPALRAAGVEMLYLGIESASPATLLRMNKVRSAAKAQRYIAGARALIQACFEHDLTLMISFMLSFPGDGEDDYRLSLDFVREMNLLHRQVAAQRDVQPGFIPLAFHTKVYTGSPLAGSLPADFPAVLLRAEPFIGESTVYSPSPGLGPDVAERYRAEIARYGAYTAPALARFRTYGAFSLADFLAAHPELTDAEGVTWVGESLRRQPQAFPVASMMMLYDKTKKASSY